MPKDPAIAVLSRLSASSLGVFRGRVAVEEGVTRDQLTRLRAAGAIERLHPDVYRMTAVAGSADQRLRAALLWAGESASATGRSAAVLYGLEGVTTEVPEIALPYGVRGRSHDILVRHGVRAAFMTRRLRGISVTGPEYTLLWLAHALEGEAFEVACEDARRRRLTTVAALRAYLERFGRRGRPGVAQLRGLLDELDPRHASRSKLEVRTRRLLVAHGISGFVREFPLKWNGRTYRYDFAFLHERTILETNGRRWHDDPADYEHDHEKWSVPGRHGYRLVLATWDKVNRTPNALLSELLATMSAGRSYSTWGSPDDAG
jgi:very-short-patch-repair endonuclease